MHGVPDHESARRPDGSSREGVGLDLVKRVAATFGFTRLPGGRQVWARVVDGDAAVFAAVPDRFGPVRRDGPATIRHLRTMVC